MARRARSLLIAAAAMLLAGSLAACGSDSSQDEPGATNAADEAEPASDADAPDDLGWVVAFSPEEYDVQELTIATSADGAQWNSVGSAPLLTGLAYGNDTWLGVDREGTVYSSDDLATWEQVASLGGDADVVDLAFGDGRFVAVGATRPPDSGQAATPQAFSSADGTTWQPSEVASVTLADPSPGSPNHVYLQNVTHADGIGFLSHAANPVDVGSGADAVTLVSPDGEAWEMVGEPHAGNGDSAAGDDTIVTGLITSEVTEDQQLRLGGLGVRTAPTDALEVVPDTPFEQRPLSSVAYGDGGFLALAAESFNEGTGSSEHGVFQSADGRSWDEVGTFDGYVSALAFGVIGGADDAETTGIRDVDWSGRSYEVCDESITLVNDRWEAPDGATFISFDGVQYGDADGDGAEDALLTFSCGPIGGNAYPNVVNLVFAMSDGELTQLGDELPGREATIVDGGVQTIDPVWAGGDPRSTPSGTKTTMWRYEDGAWVATDASDDSSTPTTASPDPSGTASGDLPAFDGSYGLVGSGCSPGGEPLPDGWWFGLAESTPTPGASFELDLACYSYEEMADEYHGHDDVVVTNENPGTYEVRVDGAAVFTCSTILDGREQPCDGYTDPAVWVRIEGGVATKVVNQLWWE